MLVSFNKTFVLKFFAMKILFCAAEAAPFAKVGGLGDVVGSLPKALANLGDEVIVCLPHYGSITSDAFTLYETGLSFSVTHEGQPYPFRVMESVLPGTSVRVFLLGNQVLFGDSKEIYPAGQSEFEALRFEVFGKAVLPFLKALDWRPDIFHLHDWHTSNIAWLLKTQPDDYFNHAGMVLSIHNMAYQGIVHGINWLEEGLLHADAVIAVSPTYAQEILTPIAGAGLESILRGQPHKLFGILNGLDETLFNPATDVFLSKRYTVETASEGKAACKASVQMEIGLPLSKTVPMFGMVTRLVEQKGLELLLPILPELAKLPAQFAFVGTGESAYEEALKAANQDTDNIRSIIGFNLALGQEVYGGSDLFLMPSHFEPCGLGQMIALQYGSVPLVRKTGGLADTVIDIDADSDGGNGFVFEPYTSEALLETIQRAINHWQDPGSLWQTMVRRGMTHDFSWRQSAAEYRKIYQNVCQMRLAGI
jgi:starch synthase